MPIQANVTLADGVVATYHVHYGSSVSSPTDQVQIQVASYLDAAHYAADPKDFVGLLPPANATIEQLESAVIAGGTLAGVIPALEQAAMALMPLLAGASPAPVYVAPSS